MILFLNEIVFGRLTSQLGGNSGPLRFQLSSVQVGLCGKRLELGAYTVKAVQHVLQSSRLLFFLSINSVFNFRRLRGF